MIALLSWRRVFAVPLDHFSRLFRLLEDWTCVNLPSLYLGASLAAEQILDALPPQFFQLFDLDRLDEPHPRVKLSSVCFGLIPQAGYAPSTSEYFCLTSRPGHAYRAVPLLCL